MDYRCLHCGLTARRAMLLTMLSEAGYPQSSPSPLICLDGKEHDFTKPSVVKVSFGGPAIIGKSVIAPLIEEQPSDSTFNKWAQPHPRDTR